MSPESIFIKHLMDKSMFPFERIIADGEPHLFTDGNTGRQYKYTIYGKDFRFIELTCRAA